MKVTIKVMVYILEEVSTTTGKSYPLMYLSFNPLSLYLLGGGRKQPLCLPDIYTLVFYRASWAALDIKVFFKSSLAQIRTKYAELFA